jgi:hypothetical protein
MRARRLFQRELIMPKKIEFTDAEREAAWSRYSTRADLTCGDIAAHLGVGRHTLRNRIREWRWPPRLQALAAVRREAARRLEGLEPGLRSAVPLGLLETPPGDAEPPAPIDLARVAAALGRSALQQLESLEAEVARGKATPERAARTLASLSRTLAAARAMEQKGGGPVDDDADEPPARSLEDIRQELARYLDRLVAEENLERSFGFDEPEGLADTA